MVNPEPFQKLDRGANVLWYCYEMEARQFYYKLVYGDRLNIIEVSLDDIVTDAGAQKFWEKIGGTGNCFLPMPKNTSEVRPPKALIDKLESITSKFKLNPAELVETAVSKGFSFEPASK
jgi:hypothetical protein